MKMNKILFVIPQLEKGGTEQLVFNLASYFQAKSFKVFLIYFYFYNDTQFLNEFKEVGVISAHIPKSRRIDFKTMNKVAKFIHNNKIDIVHAHHFISMVYCLWGSKLKNNVPLIYTEHSVWEIQNVSKKWKLLGRIFKHKLDAVVGVSLPISNLLNKILKLNISQSLSIINGIDSSKFCKKNKQETENIKSNLDINLNDKIVGIVANFRKVKNHIFLLKGFNEIVKIKKNIKLLLIGQGFDFDEKNSEEEIRSFIASHNLTDNVMLLGKRDDIPDLLSVLDIFCLTSFKEGLPLSLLEAMAAGLPVIGSRVEGIKDIIEHGKNGFLVEQGNVQELKKTILMLLNDDSLRRKMGKNSRMIVEKKYSLKLCVKKYENLYSSLSSK